MVTGLTEGGVLVGDANNEQIGRSIRQLVDDLTIEFRRLVPVETVEMAPSGLIAL